ncbi:MAG: pcmS [Deltaproteobacteria bacterium]|nr:pcmS [Deltaproteobacteria bacterium]
MDARESHNVTLKINGEVRRLDVESTWTLNDLLRNRLELTGTKRACDYGGCGSCTVLMDGVDVYSCSILAVQKSFALSYAAQCGWCTPGMILSAKALLDHNPKPTETEVRAALAGVLCRCTGYTSIVKAVLEAASVMRGEP